VPDRTGSDSRREAQLQAHRAELDALSDRLGHTFADIGLLRRAMAHRSWCAEVNGDEPSNERLEFLGDAVLGIVVTDHEMPRMHGYELIAAIRRHALSQHLPVIVCSSRSAEKYRQRAVEMGAQGYLTKPFTKEQLLGEIQRLSQPTSEPPPLVQIVGCAAP
jgi:CheY-like chemotaxis protein